MKTKLIATIALMSIGLCAAAQTQHRVQKNTGRLILNLDGVSVEGYNGKEIIFSLEDGLNEQVDERARGLKAVSAAGLSDNTGLGIQLSEKGDDLIAVKVAKTIAGTLSVKVPQHMRVSIVSSSSDYLPITIKGLKSEVAVSTNTNGITLEEISGPISITSVRGNIEAKFSAVPKLPVTMSSMYGYVDLSLPGKTSADLSLSSSYGQIYSTEEFPVLPLASGLAEQKKSLPHIQSTKKDSLGDINHEKVKLFSTTIAPSRYPAEAVRKSIALGNISALSRSTAAEDRKIPQRPLRVRINGGGTSVMLRSIFGNIYLRKS